MYIHNPDSIGGSTMFRISCLWIVLPAIFIIRTTNAGGNTGVVTDIVRSDIVTIGESFTARLTGVIVLSSGSSEIDEEISSFTREELYGKLVKLFTWTTDNTAAGIVYDADGYPFVTIYYGENFDKCFNEILLSKGFAEVDTLWLPQDRLYYMDLEKSARENGLGIWK